MTTPNKQTLQEQYKSETELSALITYPTNEYTYEYVYWLENKVEDFKDKLYAAEQRIDEYKKQYAMLQNDITGLERELAKVREGFYSDDFKKFEYEWDKQSHSEKVQHAFNAQSELAQSKADADQYRKGQDEVARQLTEVVAEVEREKRARELAQGAFHERGNVLTRLREENQGLIDRKEDLENDSRCWREARSLVDTGSIPMSDSDALVLLHDLKAYKEKGKFQ